MSYDYFENSYLGVLSKIATLKIGKVLRPKIFSEIELGDLYCPWIFLNFSYQLVLQNTSEVAFVSEKLLPSSSRSEINFSVNK